MPSINATVTKILTKGPLPKGINFDDEGLWARILVFVALVSIVASVFFLLGSKKSRPIYGQIPKEAPPRLHLTEDEDDDEEELFNATQHKLLRKPKITNE